MITRRRWPRAVIAVSLTLCDCDDTDERMRQALNQPDVLVRARAYRWWGENGRASDVPQLARGLEDSAARVRQSAVTAVGRLGPRVLSMKIVRLAAGDPDLRVQLAALRALARCDPVLVRPHLLLLLSHPDGLVRRVTQETLAKLGWQRREQVAQLAQRHFSEQLQRLQHGDLTARVTASRELGLSGRPAALSALVAAVDWAESQKLLDEVALALGRIGGPQALAKLTEMHQASQVRYRAAAAAGLAAADVGAGSARDKQLAALLADSDRLVSQAALRTWLAEDACSKLAKLPAVATATCGRMLSATKQVADAAAEIVARCRLPCPDEQASLQARLSIPDQALRAAWYLAGIPNQALASTLLRFVVERHEQWRVQSERWLSSHDWEELDPPRVAAAPAATRRALSQRLSEGLDRIAHRRLADPLIPARIDVQKLAAIVERMLGVNKRVPCAGLLSLARQVSQRPDDRVAQWALSALAQASEACSGEAKALLLEGLSSDNPSLGVAALRGCELLGDQATDRAIDLLQSRKFSLRTAAATCLARLGGRRASAALIAALKREFSLPVLRAISVTADPRAAVVLASLLGQQHALRPKARIAVINALAAVGNREQSEKVLLRELSHPNWMVRLKAVQAMKRLHVTGGRRPALACTEDYYFEVRRLCRGLSRDVSRNRDDARVGQGRR